MSHRQSIGRQNPLTQSSSGPAQVEWVSVAVLPPRLPPGLAPPTGIGAADAFSWDEAINWQHNNPIPTEEQAGRRKSFLKKAGLTTQRYKRNPDTPPYIFRSVRYDTWRKHYAKDKDGNYKGTHAPAEDCLLKPDDVQKWNFGEAQTLADKWTRGKEVLPVYAEVREDGNVPEYEVDYDGPPRDGGPPPMEPVVSQDDDDIANHLQRRDTRAHVKQQQFAALEEYENRPPPFERDSQPANRPPPFERESQPEISTTTAPKTKAAFGHAPSSGQTYDGRTAAEVIANAQARGRAKDGWKNKFRRGFEIASMGGGA